MRGGVQFHNLFLHLPRFLLSSSYLTTTTSRERENSFQRDIWARSLIDHDVELILRMISDRGSR